MTDNILDDYDGHPVLNATMQIRNTGDGLSKALAVAPVKYPIGDTLHVVLECVVEKHRYEDTGDANALTLVNMLKAGRATVVDTAAIRKALDAQDKVIKDAEPQGSLDLEEELAEKEEAS